MGVVRLAVSALLLLVIPVPSIAHAQRQMENLGRGVIALRTADGVFISWRLLGTDAAEIQFNVYRQGTPSTWQKLNPESLSDVTWWLDRTAPQDTALQYTIEPVSGEMQLPQSLPVTVPVALRRQPYLEIPLQTPVGYQPNDGSVGDLDGDGELEIVVKMEGRVHDNSQHGPTDPVQLQAYQLDGKHLWSIDLGRNIRAGAHYTQFIVYDLDGDGRAEIACKTADGTRDGAGQVIGDEDADHCNSDGTILRGPEFLTVFEGSTGKVLDTVRYEPQRALGNDNPSPAELKRVWGDDYGNRADRFLAAVAYLDGQRPSLVMCRGYYTRTVLVAWDFRQGKLQRRWMFDSNENGNRKFAGQGAHSLSVADVDHDGRDEIVYGACTIDDNGQGLSSEGTGHGDALHVTKMAPDNSRLLAFMPHEEERTYGRNAVSLRDAATSELIWGVSGSGDIGRGIACDVDPRFLGFEMWWSGSQGMFNVQSCKEDELDGPRGVPVCRTKPRSTNFCIWWDGDPLRELLDRTTINKWNWQTEREDRLLTVEGCASNNGSKSNPVFSGDLLGDWREEVIWRTSDGKALRIYSTTIPTRLRHVTFLHDPQYRLAIAWQNAGYNQPPHPGFYFGDGMGTIPREQMVVPPRPIVKGD